MVVLQDLLLMSLLVRLLDVPSGSHQEALTTFDGSGQSGAPTTLQLTIVGDDSWCEFFRSRGGLRRFDGGSGCRKLMQTLLLK